MIRTSYLEFWAYGDGGMEEVGNARTRYFGSTCIPLKSHLDGLVTYFRNTKIISDTDNRGCILLV